MPQGPVQQNAAGKRGQTGRQGGGGCRRQMKHGFKHQNTGQDLPVSREDSDLFGPVGNIGSRRTHPNHIQTVDSGQHIIRCGKTVRKKTECDAGQRQESEPALLPQHGGESKHGGKPDRGPEQIREMPAERHGKKARRAQQDLKIGTHFQKKDQKHATSVLWRSRPSSGTPFPPEAVPLPGGNPHCVPG